MWMWNAKFTCHFYTLPVLGIDLQTSFIKLLIWIYMFIYIILISHEFSRLYNFHPWHLNSFFFSSYSQSLQCSILVPQGTHHCWVDSINWEVCLTLLHMTTSGNRTPGLWILSPMPYPLGHMLPSPVWHTISSAMYFFFSSKTKNGFG